MYTVQSELRSIADEQERNLRRADEMIQQLNERLAAAEKLGRDLRAEMHRLQQRVLQTRTRISKYRVRPRFTFFHGGDMKNYWRPNRDWGLWLIGIWGLDPNY